MTITATSDNQIRKSNIRNWTIGPPQLDNWAADLRHRLPTAERFSATRGYGMCLGSFRLGASRLDDRPPFGDLGFLVGAERLRGLLLARRNDKALVDKFLAHGRIVRCANGGGVELVNDVPRRALGGEQTRPQRELEPGEPRFLRRRDFGRDCDAGLGSNRKRFDPARA